MTSNHFTLCSNCVVIGTIGLITKMAISPQIHSLKSSRSGGKNPRTATHLSANPKYLDVLDALVPPWRGLSIWGPLGPRMALSWAPHPPAGPNEPSPLTKNVHRGVPREMYGTFSRKSKCTEGGWRSKNDDHSLVAHYLYTTTPSLDKIYKIYMHI